MRDVVRSRPAVMHGGIVKKENNHGLSTLQRMHGSGVFYRSEG